MQPAILSTQPAAAAPASRAGLSLSVNAAAIALLAALSEQLLHEVCHGLAGLLVGARWEMLHLFASGESWPDGEGSVFGDIVISGGAAVVNIATGLLAVALFASGVTRSRPRLRLFTMYFAAYSLLAGFGYLMIDPLLYQPGAAGDWKKIVGLLGGGWGVRAPIALLGLAGLIFAFVWISRAVLRFGAPGDDPRSRSRLTAPLLLVPYFAVNAIFTGLAFWHPLGAEGVFLEAFKYWSGFGSFIGAHFVAMHRSKAPPAEEISPLPAGVSWPAVAVAALAISLSAAILLPGLYF
jgi:hypothetical protein